jgi:hypothetical protein
MCGDNKRFVAALRIKMGVLRRENYIVLLNGKYYCIDEKMYSVGKNGLKSRIRNCFKFSEVDVVTPQYLLKLKVCLYFILL